MYLLNTTPVHYPGLTSGPYSALATQQNITRCRLKPSKLTDCIHHCKLYIILNCDVYKLS
jgi:hypothetical protein